MSPGPATSAIAPNEYLEQTFSGLPEDSLRKILHDNAAKLYKVDA
jgi:predicted TIM-barrel fold metal-dependent hydrolase